MAGGAFLVDGGMETSLIFHQGQTLPHFAAFVLLETEEGRAELIRYHEHYLKVARREGAGFILDTATWRANPDWGRLLGYDLDGLKAINTIAVEHVAALRAKWETGMGPLVLNGAIGPRGDGYQAGCMGAAEAEDYHGVQIAAFAATQADMVTAYTMTNIDEAVGIARAARAHTMPCAISFTVETDGRLVTGKTLREAIETVDEETDGYAAYFMINCAHPTHFDQSLAAGATWVERIRGVRANASTKSHAELDEADTLDEGDPADLGRRYRALTRAFPQIRILGGCCGTDHRHLTEICTACAPVTAVA